MSRNAPEAFQRLLAEAGCCRTCRHAELKTTARSAFVWCRRSEADSRFSRYPRLPVIDCPGYREFPGAGDLDEGGGSSSSTSTAGC